MSELLSMRAYARLRGCSVEAVSKAVRTGRVSTVLDEKGNRKIDPERADAEWAGTTREKIDNAEPTPPAAEEQAEEGTPRPKGPSYAQSRAIREVFAAKLARLEFEQKTGRLVDGDEIRKLWVTVATIVKTKMLGVPAKAKQQMPELRPEQYLILEKIVREALEELADERT